MSVINNELTCLALTGCVPLNAHRRSASCVVEGVQSDATQLNSTRCRVELSCVAIKGVLCEPWPNGNAPTTLCATYRPKLLC